MLIGDIDLGDEVLVSGEDDDDQQVCDQREIDEAQSLEHQMLE